jgi:hypothetical protein
MRPPIYRTTQLGQPNKPHGADVISEDDVPEHIKQGARNDPQIGPPHITPKRKEMSYSDLSPREIKRLFWRVGT